MEYYSVDSSPLLKKVVDPAMTDCPLPQRVWRSEASSQDTHKACLAAVYACRQGLRLGLVVRSTVLWSRRRPAEGHQLMGHHGWTYGQAHGQQVTAC